MRADGGDDGCSRSGGQARRQKQSSVSSILSRSLKYPHVHHEAQPTRKPVTTDAQSGTNPEPGVMPARPAKAPFIMSVTWKQRSWRYVSSTQVRPDVDAERWVFNRAAAADAVPARAEQPLKEYQPAQTMVPPMTS